MRSDEEMSNDVTRDELDDYKYSQESESTECGLISIGHLFGKSLLSYSKGSCLATSATPTLALMPF